MDNNQNTSVPTPLSSPQQVEIPPQSSAPQPVVSNNNVVIEQKNINSTPQKQTISYEEQYYNNKQLVNSDELIKAFIGPNYDKIMKRIFNFGAFFFGAFYYFYRKMPLFGFIIVIINCLICYFLSGYTILYVLGGFNLLLGFITNKLYVRRSLKKISKLLINYANYPVIEVRGMCRIYGGVSTLKVINATLLLILLAFPTVIILYFILTPDKLSEYLNDLNISIPEVKVPEIKVPEISLDNKFEGYIVVEKSVKVLDYFAVQTPSVFTPTSNDDEYQAEYTFKSNKKKLGNCTYSFKGVSGFTNPKSLINGMHEYFIDKNPSDVRETYINKINWYTFNYSTDEANIYYYACTRGKYVFLYTYIDEKESSNVCHSYNSEIINSIVFK